MKMVCGPSEKRLTLKGSKFKVNSFQMETDVQESNQEVKKMSPLLTVAEKATINQLKALS